MRKFALLLACLACEACGTKGQVSAENHGQERLPVAPNTTPSLEPSKATALLLFAAKPNVAFKAVDLGVQSLSRSSWSAVPVPVPYRLSSPTAQALTRRTLLLGAGAATALSFGTPAIAADSDVFNPDAGSLVGSTVLITGANSGLGLESAKRLAAAGACVIVGARSKAKADAAAKAVADSTTSGKAVPIELDLANLASVKSVPKRLEAAFGKSPTIDVLMNNAGVMAVPERLTTSDGFEKTVGINHLGHFALFGALLPNLLEAKSGFRVITVSSDAHKFVDKNSMIKAIDAKLDPDYAAAGWGAYGLSKASNVLFTVELERRLEAAGIKGSAVSLSPGVVQTDLPRYVIGGVAAEDKHLTQEAPPPTGIGKLFKETLLDKAVQPVDKGANTQVYLAAARDSDGDRSRRGGMYFESMKPSKASDTASDSELAKKLWDASEKLTDTKIKL